jgi:hypothetical protein
MPPPVVESASPYHFFARTTPTTRHPSRCSAAQTPKAIPEPPARMRLPTAGAMRLERKLLKTELH